MNNLQKAIYSTNLTQIPQRLRCTLNISQESNPIGFAVNICMSEC